MVPRPQARPALLRAAACLVALAPALAACAAAAGSGAEEPAAAPNVAVLPALWETESGGIDADLRGAAVAGVLSAGVPTIEDGDSATDGFDAACADDFDCLRRLGERLGAAKLLWVRLAGLGDTVAVRLGLVDAASGTQESARQDVLHGATAQELADAVEREARELALPLAPPPQTPWYENWWVWTSIGAGALAASGAAAAGVLLSGDEPAGPDVTVTPP